MTNRESLVVGRKSYPWNRMRKRTSCMRPLDPAVATPEDRAGFSFRQSATHGSRLTTRETSDADADADADAGGKWRNH